MGRSGIFAWLAGYYAATGAWPLVSMRTFEAVTGRKTDRWLVKTVGALTLADAMVFAAASERGDDEPSSEAVILAVTSAAAFAAVDVVFVARRRIRAVYLADAAVQLALLTALLRA